MFKIIKKAVAPKAPEAPQPVEKTKIKLKPKEVVNAPPAEPLKHKYQPLPNWMADPYVPFPHPKPHAEDVKTVACTYCGNLYIEPCNGKRDGCTGKRFVDERLAKERGEALEKTPEPVKARPKIMLKLRAKK